LSEIDATLYDECLETFLIDETEVNWIEPY